MVKKRTIIDIVIALTLCLVILIGMYWPHKYPSAWWKYIKENKSDQIQQLISSKKIDLEQRIAGYTPLLYACFLGRFKIAKMLVQAGADPNVTNGSITSLQRAAGAGDFELVKMLIEKGADPNFGLKVGIVPLCAARNYEIVRFLVEHGAKVNVSGGFDGYTPLMAAINVDDNLSAKYLIQNGANIQSTSKNGDTALSIAKERHNTEISNLLMVIIKNSSEGVGLTSGSVHLVE